MLHLSLCSISFRHHLISINELFSWGREAGFQGIELWGAHARHLSELNLFGHSHSLKERLNITMISDYLPLPPQREFDGLYCEALAKQCCYWGARKLRTFAGGQGSAVTTEQNFSLLVSALRLYCDILKSYGLDLLIETHPNTYADNSVSTARLLAAVGRDNLKVNFDVLHIWEAKECPVQAWWQLKDKIAHLHLKNISQRQYLKVFEPANIYSASGDRRGIVPIMEGAYDYQSFIKSLPQQFLHYASLEWFGERSFNVLQADCQQLMKLDSETKAAVPA